MGKQPTLCQGIVRSYGASKGFGFIKCADLQEELFFSHRQIPSEVMEAIWSTAYQMEGKAVIFQLTYSDKDKKHQAAQVTPMAGPGAELVGRVGSVSAAFGALACCSLPGSLIYFQASEVPIEDQPGICMGSAVKFTLRVLPDGSYQAMKLALIGPPKVKFQKGKEGADGCTGGMANCGGKTVANKGVGNDKPFNADKLDKPRFGLVKSYDAASGWGAIMSGETDGDIHFQVEGSSFEPGQSVSFLMDTMQGGNYMAKHVVAGLESGDLCAGHISSFNVDKGFGFVAVLGTQGEVYVNKRALPAEVQCRPDLNLTGRRVRIKIKNMPDGSPHGFDVQLMDTLEPPPPAKRAKTGDDRAETNVLGNVKTWDALQGLGLISSEHAPLIPFKGDFPQAVAGALVRFTRAVGPDGLLEARDVQFVDAAV